MNPSLPSPRLVSARVVSNVNQLRDQEGWNLARLAKECSSAGFAYLNFTTVTNLLSARDFGESAPAPRRKHVTVDELVDLAAVFGVPADSLLTAPTCDQCFDRPPLGFSCLACGAGGSAK